MNLIRGSLASTARQHICNSQTGGEGEGNIKKDAQLVRYMTTYPSLFLFVRRCQTVWPLDADDVEGAWTSGE